MRRGASFVFNRPLLLTGFIAIVTIVALSCGGDSGSCDNPPNITGNWSGPLTDNTAGAGTLQVTFTETGCDLQGTWVASFPASPAANNGGTLTGDADGTAVQVALSPNDGEDCSFLVTGTITSPTAISGSYMAIDCSVSGGGSFTITKAGSGTPNPTSTTGPTTTATAGATATPTTTPTTTPTP